jgi:hypothetical protein
MVGRRVLLYSFLLWFLCKHSGFFIGFLLFFFFFFFFFFFLDLDWPRYWDWF